MNNSYELLLLLFSKVKDLYKNNAFDSCIITTTSYASIEIEYTKKFKEEGIKLIEGTNLEDMFEKYHIEKFNDKDDTELLFLIHTNLVIKKTTSFDKFLTTYFSTNEDVMNDLNKAKSIQFHKKLNKKIPNTLQKSIKVKI